MKITTSTGEWEIEDNEIPTTDEINNIAAMVFDEAEEESEGEIEAQDLFDKWCSATDCEITDQDTAMAVYEKLTEWAAKQSV